MFRRVVLSSTTDTSGVISAVYYVKNPRFLSQSRVMTENFYSSGSNPSTTAPTIFSNAVRFSTTSSIGKKHYYVFDFDVSDNQPTPERVSEISAAGITIAVYNADGVLVCDSGVGVPAAKDPTHDITLNAPGEMDTATGTEPGEMTSVPGEEPGEMAGETTDEPGAMI